MSLVTGQAIFGVGPFAPLSPNETQTRRTARFLDRVADNNVRELQLLMRIHQREEDVSKLLELLEGLDETRRVSRNRAIAAEIIRCGHALDLAALHGHKLD